ncbi:trypsin-like peptidase domain-containing protein [Kibdelosporangium philippinense]|uniref:Trypsin-like peptidase domain-containing protein n=1 Tax=Kibdelosporangium philippinense TaxID=211113 RepID=A0ABS8ZJ35_9PSEU|nr:trypsin-like peptidase domain-containing protein [Kibdelosporangium philippinense]MCE7006970.1 trypsin-like peptidase domain-containing protein [Kibdelosporangium philippinense]
MPDAAIVRVFRGREPVGMGCLVGDRHVVTCAHVVARALGVDGSGPAPALPVRVDFPLVAPDQHVESTVVAWSPYGDGYDVAGLVLETAPERARPARLVSADALWGHEVRAFGVPSAHDAGVWATGVLRGSTVGGLVQIDDDRTAGFAVASGFSGTPVWDETVDAVVGIAAQAERDSGRRTSYLLPTGVLTSAWPELTRLSLVRSPFRGLRPFREVDAANFHGRSARVTDVVDALRRDRFVALVGPSGVGKSSLAMAGVVPALRRAGHAVAAMRPGVERSIWAALATALAPLAPEREITADALGVLTPESLPDLLPGQPLDADPRRVLVVVDQFEDVRHDEDAPDTVLRALAALTAPRVGWSVSVLITVRGDMVGDLVEHAGVAGILNDRVVLLGPPDADELRAIIEEPLRAPGMPQYAPGLAERIAADAPSVSLALLQFSLTMLWERQRAGVIEHTGYAEIGGITGAVGRYAEGIWTDLDPESADTAWRLFLQLLSPFGDTGYARRRLDMSALSDPLREVADRLTTTRLITVDDDGRGGRMVELAHEQLVAGWPRLRGWADRERQFRRWQDDIARQTDRWRAANRERALLPRGSELRTAVRRVNEHPDNVQHGELEFVRAAQRSRRRTLALRVGAVVAVAMVLAVAGFVWWQRVADRRAEELAQLQADADRTLDAIDSAPRTVRERLLIGLRAGAVAATERTDARLSEDVVALRHVTTVTDLRSTAIDHEAVDPTGTRMARTDGLTNRVTITPLNGNAAATFFTLSPDLDLANRVTFVDADTVAVSAKRLAPSDKVVGEDVIELRDVTTGTLARSITPNPGKLSSDNPQALNVDRTGRTLAYGEPKSRTLSLIELDGPGRVDLTLDTPLRGENSAGSTLVAVRGPDSVILLEPRGPDGTYPLVSVSPAGRIRLPTMPNGGLVHNNADDVIMAGCFDDKAVKRHVVIGLAERHMYREREVHGSTCDPDELRLDRTGRWLIARFRAGTGTDVLAVWSLDGAQPDRRFAVPAVVPGEDRAIAAADIAADGSGRVVLRDDENALGVHIPAMSTLDSTLAAAEVVQFSPDATHVYVLCIDGSLQAWDMRSGAMVGAGETKRPRDPYAEVVEQALAVSPDGRWVVTADLDGGPNRMVDIHEAPGLRKIGELTLPELSLADVELAFTGPDELLTHIGRHVITWDLRTMRERRAVEIPQRQDNEGPVGPAYVLPASREIVVVYTDGTVTRLHSGGGNHMADFRLPYDVSREVVAAAHDSGILALALADRVELWDLATRARVDSLPVSGRVGHLEVTNSGATVEIRYATRDKRPENLPADNGVHHPDPLGPNTLRWERNGVFATGTATPGHTSDGGHLLNIHPVPALVPADTATARAAICRVVGTDDLPAELTNTLPEPARRVTGCP